MLLAEGSYESDRVPLQGRSEAERTRSAPSLPIAAGAVFQRAVAAGNVWISGLGLGAGSADLLVNDPDWRGTPEMAREFFYHGLGNGHYGILGANVVYAGVAERARRAEQGR